MGISDDPKKEAVVRVCCVIWTMTVMLIITYFGSKFLVEELEKYANYDTLTHLLNRRSMDNYLQEAYRQANTGRSSFCLLMADIDDFKKVNDTYGHDCGDEVLKYVAQTISAAERIRADIARDAVNYRNEANVSVTVTMGVAPYKDGMSIQDMMDDADAKLYWGKQQFERNIKMLFIKTLTIVLLAAGMMILYASALRFKGVLAVAEGCFDEEGAGYDNAVSAVNVFLGLMLVCVAVAAMLI